MKKLASILLVDDDNITNFINKRMIDDCDCAEQTVVKQDAQNALSYLEDNKTNSSSLPDLILLDINMPGMNGWEFVEAYNKLTPSLDKQIVIVMLTTSQNPDDRSRAASLSEIAGFENKPLNKEKLEGLIGQHFST